MSKHLHPTHLAAALLLGLPGTAQAQQDVRDQADEAIGEERALERERRDEPRPDRPSLESGPSAASEIGEAVTVGAVVVEGAEDLRPAAFAPVINKYVGRTLSSNELRSLATEIADVARAAGYGLATAWIPEQTLVNGVLRVRLDEGRIDGVEAKGKGSRLVERALAPLADGRPMKTSRLERQLLLAGDVAGIWVGKARLDRREGRNILVVDTRQDRAKTRLYLDNWGSSTVGPVRARAVQDFFGLLGGNDRVTLGGVVTPFEPDEFGLLRLGFAKGVGTDGTELVGDAYYARSEAGGRLSDRDIDGRSVELELAVSHPFLRTRAASVWGEMKLGFRDAEQTRLDIPARNDRIASLSAGAYAVGDLSGGRGRARLELTQGLDILDATHEGDPLASRSDGSAIFTKLELWGQYQRPLGDQFSLQASAEAQLASRPLLSSEEMGIGGRYFLRGYDYREFSGDKGVTASFELRFDIEKLPNPLSAGQLYVYGDAGSVGNYRDGSGGGSLASAGGGARFWLDRKIEAGVELGIPLADGFDGNRPDPRLSLTLGASF